MGLKVDKETLSKMYDAMRRKLQLQYHITSQEGNIELSPYLKMLFSLHEIIQYLLNKMSKMLYYTYPGMKNLIKKYELPKPEEVNVYKQKLERIHAELASSSNK